MASTENEEVLATAPGPLLLTVLGCIMVTLSFGLGSTLEMDNIRQTVKRKLPLAIGFACKYGVMPAVSYGLAKAFNFSPGKSVGLLLCGIVPSGPMSNMFTYYSGGDVALSIFVSVTSLLAALGMVPLWLWAYGTPMLKEALGSDDNASISRVPFGDIMVSLVIVFVPTLCGIFLRSRSELWAKRAEKMGSIVGAIFLVVAVITALIDNIQLFLSDASTWIASLVLSLAGFGSGALACWCFRLDPIMRLTIGLSTGLPNSILSITLAVVVFADASINVRNEALVFPLLFSFWILALASVLVAAFQIPRFLRKRNGKVDEEKTEDIGENKERDIESIDAEIIDLDDYNAEEEKTIEEITENAEESKEKDSVRLDDNIAGFDAENVEDPMNPDWKVADSDDGNVEVKINNKAGDENKEEDIQNTDDKC